MIRQDNNGYYYESDVTGERYEIQELVSVGADRQYTSDIIAILYTGDLEADKPSKIIGHFWGASFFEPNDECEQIIADIVATYENKPQY